MFLLEGNPSPPGRGVGGEGQRGMARSRFRHSAARRLEPTSYWTENFIHRLVKRALGNYGHGNWGKQLPPVHSGLRGAGKGRNQDPQDVHSCWGGGTP